MLLGEAGSDKTGAHKPGARSPNVCPSCPLTLLHVTRLRLGITKFLVHFWKDLCIPDVSEIQSYNGFHCAEHCDTVRFGRDCNAVKAGVQYTSSDI